MNKLLKYFLVILFAGSLFLLPAPSQAAKEGIQTAGEQLEKVIKPTGLSKNEEGKLSVVIGRGINLALSLVGVIFLILMVYGGILWMTARGEESQIEKSQRIIVAAMIGLFIVVSAYAITTLVTNSLTQGAVDEQFDDSTDLNNNGGVE